MLVYGSKLNRVPIIALSSGGQIAVTSRPVIDWTSLKVIGLLLETSAKPSAILMIQDIREYNTELILVNSEDDLIEADEIIRLRPLLSQDFRIVGAYVKTESGSSLGSVSDYTFDPKTFMIQQLYVKRPLLKSLMTDNLIIDRAQIVEVNPPVITVRDATAKQPLGVTTPALTE